MPSIQEFRDLAEESLSWAQLAKTDKERDLFLRIARSWRETAARFESSPPLAMSAQKRSSVNPTT